MSDARTSPLRHSVIGRRRLGATVGVALAAALGWWDVYTVDETQVAVVQTFGHAAGSPVVVAGLGLKWPWQSVHYADRRVRTLLLDLRQKLTRDRENVLVQPRVCWRASGEAAERFLRSAGDDATAEALLTDLVWRSLDRELADRPLTDWFNPVGDRDPAGNPPFLARMASVTAACQSEAFTRFGIDLLDVQLQQFSRPERAMGDLRRLMEADHRREAGRSGLEVDLQRTRLEVDARRQADRILSDAEDRAARLRSEGRREARQLESQARALSSPLTDYVLQLDGYRRLNAADTADDMRDQQSGTRQRPAPATQPSVPKIKPAPTGRAPTPGTEPIPRSGKKASSAPG